MTLFRHRYATRLNSFRHGHDTLSAVRRVADVPGISAIEINYPEHTGRDGDTEIFKVARELGMEVSALNLRYDPVHFRLGAFTNPDSGTSHDAVTLTCDAVDLAVTAGIPHVILWMGQDGVDYPFQADYRALWDQEIAGFRAVATRRPDIRVSVEYKPSDPRRTSLIRSMGEAMLAVQETDQSNFGVTLDFCHSLMAGEIPAMAASLAMRSDKLFGIHLNDGYGPTDDGLMVASVHFQQTLELLWTLRTGGYTGTLYFDTFPDRLDPSKECAANIAEVERMERILGRIDASALQDAQASQDALIATALIRQAFPE